jgi:ubiquinone/menaquinone biosynthesis C-methylase UbiE
VAIRPEHRIMRDDPQSAVTRLFDAMAPEYDRLEPWYEHLYARLHAILADTLTPRRGDRTARALDAGCGHGAQTALLHALGYRTHGADLSGALLRIARQRVPAATFARADITALPYASGAFDVVSCCGSTLSFVDDPAAALAELSRVLRPGGRLLVECEHAPSLDLGWTALSAVLRDVLGYGVAVRTLRRALRGRASLIRLPYPGYGDITLFRTRVLRRRLTRAGFRWRRAWGVHSITNVIPSTLLHRARLPRPLAALYSVLRVLDAAIETSRPARALANSLVVLAQKR